MSLLDKCNNLMIPSGYKVGKLFSIIPNTAAGDFSVDRNSVSTRIDTNKYINNIAVNIPRLDYSNSLCPKLLLYSTIEQIITYPINFDYSYWTKTRTSLTSSITSPHIDYTTDAFKLVENGDDNTHFIEKTGINTTAETYITNTIYVKKGERTWISFEHTFGGSGYTDNYDLDNATWGTGNFYSHKATALVNNWYKITLTGLAGNDTTSSIRYYMATGDTATSYTGDTTSGLYIYGNNLNETNIEYPFIYDGTEGSTTTLDNDEITGATYSGSSESGVFYVNMESFIVSGTTRSISINDGSSSNYVKLNYDSTANRISYGINVASTITTGYYDVTDITSSHKIGVRWIDTDFSLWIDGIERSTNTGTTFGADVLTQIDLDVNGSEYLYGGIIELGTFYYLTDAEMLELGT